MVHFYIDNPSLAYTPIHYLGYILAKKARYSITIRKYLYSPPSLESKLKSSYTGPLLWHWENNTTNDPSIELSLDEVKELARQVGFEISVRIPRI